MRKWSSVFLAAFLVAGIASVARAEEPAYPRADLILEPAELAKPEAAAQFVVIDARPAEQYRAEHVPGARWVDHAAWQKAFGRGADAAAWSERIGALGVNAETAVVIYDDNQTKDAARIWWILRYWGVEHARLLNGGWRGWKSGGLPVETTAVAIKPVEFKAVARDERLATKDELLSSLAEKSFQIVDARSEKEHCGIDKLSNKRAGAIPGAKHLEWSDLIDADSQRFKSADELKKLFAAAGVTLDRPTVTHCQGGGRAAVMAFGLELMGAKDVGNYYASWGEWGNADDTPITPGTPKPSSKESAPAAPPSR